MNTLDFNPNPDKDADTVAALDRISDRLDLLVGVLEKLTEEISWHNRNVNADQWKAQTNVA